MNPSLNISGAQPTKQSLWIEWVFNTYLRLLAIVFFLFAIFTWLQAVGYWDGPNNRFDTMTRNWKIYTAVMLVLFPATSVGLWSTMVWGRVVWFIAIAFQSIALLRYGQQLGNDELYLMFHLITFSIYLIFLAGFYFINKKR